MSVLAKEIANTNFIGGIIMLDILHTLVLLPISQGAFNLLIEEYPDATVEDDCLFIISRGSGIADVLIDVSRKFKEVFEVRHIYSSELHTAIYVDHYNNGVRTLVDVIKCKNALIDGITYVLPPNAPLCKCQ